MTKSLPDRCGSRTEGTWGDAMIGGRHTLPDLVVSFRQLHARVSGEL